MVNQIVWIKNQETKTLWSEDGRFEIVRRNGKSSDYFNIHDYVKQATVNKLRISQKVAKQLAQDIMDEEERNAAMEGKAFHHVDGNPCNNDLANLKVVNIPEHVLPMPSAEQRTKKAKKEVEQEPVIGPGSIEALEQKEPINRLTWFAPIKEETNVSTWTTWATECGRYKITRSISNLKDGENYFAVLRGKKILKNNLRSLNSALLCAEHDLQAILNQDIETNDMTTLEAAEKLGLAGLPDGNTPEKRLKTLASQGVTSNNTPSSGSQTPTEGVTKTMQIKESAARTLLTAVGMTSVEKCNLKRLTTKLNGLPLVQAELKEPEDSEQKAMLQNVLDALQEGEKIQITSDDEGETEVVAKKTAKKETSKPVKAEKVPKEEKPVKTEKAKKEAKVEAKANPDKKPKKERTELSKEKDKFGCRLGSMGTRANAVLTKKPKKMKQIVEEAKLDDTMFDHFKKMIAKGFVAKTEEGFCLASTK